MLPMLLMSLCLTSLALLTAISTVSILVNCVCVSSMASNGSCIACMCKYFIAVLKTRSRHAYCGCYVAPAMQCIAAAFTAHQLSKVAASYQCLLFLDNVHCCAVAQEHFSSVGEVERADVVMESRSTSRPVTSTNTTTTATTTAATTIATADTGTASGTTADTTAEIVAVVPAEQQQQQQQQPKSKGYGIVRFATIEAAQASHSLLPISSIALAANSSVVVVWYRSFVLSSEPLSTYAHPPIQLLCAS
eukprot:3841-Heterococcus_DN1.PRE.1